MVTHWMHVYQKPARANRGTVAAPVFDDKFFGKFVAYEYTHRVNAMGGFDTASCRLDVGIDTAERVFSDYMGNRVAFYIDDPMFPIWEGFINRVTIKRGGIAISRSLDEMINRAQVIWTRTGATPQTQITAEVLGFGANFYGHKGGIIEAGNQYTGGATLATALRDKIVAQYSFPQISTIFEGGGEYEVRVECLGFYHTLNWDVFAITSTTSYNAHEAILRLGTNTTAGSQSGYNSSRFVGNAYGIFYNTESARIVLGNTSFQTTLEKRSGETHWQKMVKIAEAGDGVRDWIVGITRTDPSLRYRELYYFPATTQVRYYYSIETGRMVDEKGRELRPWEIGPDRTVQITDMFRGLNSSVQDPRNVWIQTVEYDGESGEVTWTTKDSLNASGVFGLGKTMKQHGKNFGANERVIYL